MPKTQILIQFINLDDVSLDYSFKRLQEHFYTPLKFLTSNLIDRRLHKVQWSDTPLEDALIYDIRKKCRAKYSWTAEEADTLIWIGSESNSAYTRDDDEIQILLKSGEIRPFSSFLESPVKIAFSKKYYICHPGLK
jgi:hypothetical protein